MGRGTISHRGNKRRLWLEVVRPETERTYLSYQLFTLRRSHDGPFEDQRAALEGESFYDDEQILFHGEGLHAAYDLLYPRDRKHITKEVLDITGLMGLTALWIDYGTINNKGEGLIKGRLGDETYRLLHEHIREFGINAGKKHAFGQVRGVLLNREAMEAFARLIRPYAHYSMKAKLQLRKSPQGSGQTRSQPTDREANAMLRRVGQHSNSKRSWPQIRQGKQQVQV